MDKVSAILEMESAAVPRSRDVAVRCIDISVAVSAREKVPSV